MFGQGPSNIEGHAYGSKTSHVITCEGVEPVGCAAVGDNVIGKVRDLLAFHPGEG